MKTNNGGPAFPALNFIVPRDLHEAGCRRLGEAQGMSLRDYFAAFAMQRLLVDFIEDDAARLAYKAADAMLKAREQS